MSQNPEKFNFINEFPACGSYEVVKYQPPFELESHFLQFTGPASFASGDFKNSAHFKKSVFNSIATFTNARFKDSANFSESTFQSMTLFSETEFDSLADFVDASFASQAFFYDTEFHDDAFFLSEFEGNTSFSRAAFHGLASFTGSKFNARVDFSDAKFKTNADFSEASFKGEVDFFFAMMPDTLTFEKSKTASTINLRNVRFQSPDHFCYIDLRDAPIEQFKLRYDHFRILHPKHIDYEEFGRLTYVYERLLKNFKDNGYINDYETVDKEYQEFKLTQNPNKSFISPYLNLINKYWNNYGYNKEWIWSHTVRLFFVFFFINLMFFPILATKVYEIPSITNRFKKNAKIRAFRWKKGYYSPLMLGRYAFYYTALIFFGLKVSVENLNYDRRAVAYIFLQYVTGLVCVGYLANFIISSGLIGS